MTTPTVNVIVTGARGPNGLSAKQIAIAMGEIPADASDEDFFNWLVSQYELTVTSASGQAVTTRALLAAIVSPINGQCAILTEAGRCGIFKFSTANLSAMVTADPHQGIYVPPAADTDGSSGAWVRQHNGTADGAWWGSPVDGTTDDADRINSALDLDEVSTLVLQDGIHAIETAFISIPSGKTLQGQGPTATILKAIDGLQDVATSMPVVQSAPGSTGVTVRDLGIDVDEIGLGEGDTKRVAGVIMLKTTGFLVERVHVTGATGYAFWANGDSDVENTPSRGTFRSCQSENSQIGFEADSSDGVLFEDCHARKTTGTVPAFSFFHPLNTAKNIRYQACTGKGTANAGFDPQANGSANLGEIIVEDMVIDLEGNGAAIGFAPGAPNEYDGFKISGSRFTALEGTGAVFRDVTVEAVNSTFEGVVGIEANTTDGELNGCKVIGASDPGGVVAAKGIVIQTLRGEDPIRLTGGTIISATGPAGTLDIDGRVMAWLGSDVKCQTFSITDAVFANEANTTVTDLSSGYYLVAKSGGGAGLDAGADTNAAFTGNFIAEIIIPAFTATRFGITDTATGVDGTNIDVSLFTDESGRVLEEFAGTPYSAYGPGERFWFWRIGETVSVFQGGVRPEKGRLIKTETHTGDAFVDISIATASAKVIARAFE